MRRPLEPPTVHGLLELRAHVDPDRWFLRFPEDDLTYLAFLKRAQALARGILVHDVGGHHDESRPPPLPTLLPNCADAISLWFATNRNGLTWAPINTEFRGAGLAHAVNLTRSRDAVVDRNLLTPLAEVAPHLTHLERVFVRGFSGADLARVPWEAVDFRMLQDPIPGPPDPGAARGAHAPRGSLAPGSRPDPGDPSLLIYTSGTTGPSKACELSHAYVLAQGQLLARSVGVGPDDVLFCPYPIFHWDAVVGTIVPALLHGATAVIAERFSVSRFWQDVRRYGVTIFDFMGATLSFLHKQPPAPDDRDNPARLGWGVPMPAFKRDFEERFDVTLIEGYGSTEGGIMACQEPGEDYPPGSCGRPLPEFDLCISDEAGHPLEAGAVGEILVRPADGQNSHLMMTGYFRMPEATRHAFRGGWFHTGDLGRLDDAGNLYFEGRTKDVIRRRGENISAFEIEQAVSAHPDILEAAAYGVPSPDTEEEVALAVVLRPGRTLSTEALMDYCGQHLARFMIPSHVRFLDRLPKTPTEKVAKSVLQVWHHAAGPDGVDAPR